MSRNKYMRVQLRVPGWAQPGQNIEASAGGKKFSVKIPESLRPGQFFTVRVPLDGSSEQKAQPKVTAAEVAFNLEPNIIIGNDKYFKEVKKCQDWCDISRICCPYVTFAGKTENITLRHSCCCLPCCFNFSISSTKHGTGETMDIGMLAPASCRDQNCQAVCCPCFYQGPKMQAKFLDEKDSIKYTLKSEIKCCQYLWVACFLCSPCSRCYRFCCKDAQYTRYVQNVYGSEINDNTVFAKIIYTDRMICPCIPDERIQMRIEPNENRPNISKEDLVLLSIFPTLISGYTCIEFCVPLCIPGGMFCSMPTPSGINEVNDANNIQAEYMNIQEALEDRKQDDMY